TLQHQSRPTRQHRTRLVRLSVRQPGPKLAAVQSLTVVTMKPFATAVSAVSAVPARGGVVYGDLRTALPVLVGVLPLAGARALVPFGGAQKWPESRLAAPAPAAAVPTAPPPGRRSVLAPLFASTERLLANADVYKRTSRLLERADVSVRAVEFFY